MELGEALGLKGFGAELFTTTASTVTNHVIGNLLLQGQPAFAGLDLHNIGEGLGGGGSLPNLIGSAIGTFIGARLGAMVVSPQTQAAVALSSIGSAVGAYVAVSSTLAWAAAAGIGNSLTLLGSIIVPGVGAFVGFVLGALIGNLFGSKKPRTPTANAEVYLNYTTDQFQLGASSASNGGNLELVKSMATTARDTLNGFLVQLAGDFDYDTATGYRRVSDGMGWFTNVPSNLNSYYGHTAGQLWVKLGSVYATQENVASADEAVSKGVMWSLRQTSVIGGDIFAKRALEHSQATDLTSLLGDLQIASDYRFYANNRELINGYITGAYSTLTQGEKDMYEAKDGAGAYIYKGLIDKVHAQGLDVLTTAERGVYDTYSYSIDRIIQALEDQSIANPWIITLQRISELKLDQWSASDFNGGLQGFLMSFNLESKQAHFEDVRIRAAAGGAVVSVTNPAAQDGIFEILPQALDGPTNNLIVNARWEQGQAGWHMGAYNGVQSPAVGVNLGGGWSGGGNDVMFITMQGMPDGDDVVDNYTDPMTVRAGATYDISVEAGQHRGIVQAYVQFWDQNGGYLGATFLPGAAQNYGAAQGDLANMTTIGGQVVAPAGASTARLGLRLWANGVEANPYGFFARPVMREVTSQVLAWDINNDIANPRWTNALSGWLASIGVNGTSGVNLNSDWSGQGNDVLWAHYENEPGSGAAPAAGNVLDNRSDYIATRSGATYEFSVRAAQHRSVSQLFVEWFDANHNYILGQVIASGGREMGGYHGDPGNFDLLTATATAPAGAAYRRIGLRMLTTGGDLPYAFFTQPMSRELGVDWETRGNSLRIADLAAIGYTQLTSGNTSGRDFIDRSAATSGVVLSDYQADYVSDGYWEWQGGGPPPIVADPENVPGYVYIYNPQYNVISGGDDIFIGGFGNDHLLGYDGWDWLEGGAGNDILEGGAGNDVLLGGEGRDILYGGAGDDYLVSGSGDDHPWAGDGWNAGMWGGDGNDIIVFNGGIDGGIGENGDDIFLMEQDGYTAGWEASGNYDGNFMDYVDAGSGSDTVSFERYTTAVSRTLDPGFWYWAGYSSLMPAGGINGVMVALWNHPSSWSNGDAYWADAKYIMGDWIKGVENVTGSPFNDYLWGDAGDNIIKGGDGDDFLDSHLGNDVLEGGAGADYLLGADITTASYEGSNAGVYVNLTTSEAYGGHATGDRLNSIEHLKGSRFADELTGDGGANRLTGLGGDDWLVATGGADIFDGGEGLDTADYSSATSGVSLSLGNFANGATTGGSGWGGLAYGHTYIDVEAVLGSSYDDYLASGSGSQEFMGGAGNDTLVGGADSDTYYFERGDGFDQIVEDNTGSNVLSFGSDIKVGDLGFGWQSHSTGVFEIFLLNSPTGDRVRVQGNVVAVGNNKLKVIDFNGGGQLDVSGLTRMRVGGNGDDTVYGESDQVDLIAGYGGNDVLYGTNQSWESTGNVFIGGGGADYMVGSIGDDQYAFDVGNSYDTVVDSGGEDTLVFGSTVAANDVRVEVQGADLVVFYNPADSNDHVRIANGGYRYHNVYSGEYTFNTIEYINAGGTWIDIRKLDIAWTDVEDYSGGWYPIVLDLAGDGLNLTSVDESRVVSRLENGQLARVGWVGPTDGILAFDRNGDGAINHLSEISFVGDKEGAKTDLEGLQAWDTNGDGKLSAHDKGWGDLKIWVDRNQNGRSTASELRTLEEVGITELSLTGRPTGYTGELGRDSYVHNTLDFTWSDGSTGTGYDVVLMRRLIAESGLTSDQVRDAWGSLGADAELGRLLNDPLPPAPAASRPGTTSGSTLRTVGDGSEIVSVDVSPSIEGAGGAIDARATLADILARAEVDFSDHDDLYDEDEARWGDALTGRRGVSDGYVETDASVLGSLSRAASTRGAFGRAFGGPSLLPDLEDEFGGATGDSQAAMMDGGKLTSASETGRSAWSPGSEQQERAYLELDDAASVLDGENTQALDIAPITLAQVGDQRPWWTTGKALDLSFGDYLPPVGDSAQTPSVGVNAAGNRAISNDRQKLLQALASFGRDKGASAAVWTRGDDPAAHGALMGAHRALPLAKANAQSLPL